MPGKGDEEEESAVFRTFGKVSISTSVKVLSGSPSDLKHRDVEVLKIVSTY